MDTTPKTVTTTTAIAAAVTARTVPTFAARTVTIVVTLPPRASEKEVSVFRRAWQRGMASELTLKDDTDSRSIDRHSVQT